MKIKKYKNIPIPSALSDVSKDRITIMCHQCALYSDHFIIKHNTQRNDEGTIAARNNYYFSQTIQI